MNAQLAIRAFAKRELVRCSPANGMWLSFICFAFLLFSHHGLDPARSAPKSRDCRINTLASSLSFLFFPNSSLVVFAASSSSNTSSSTN
ncbi:hypothetical protein ACSS6W_003801 [Trichoderma asperelloides]